VEKFELVDSHCHFDFPVLRERYPQLRAEALAAGIQQIVVPGVTANSWSTLQSFCAADFMLYPAFGLHPCFMADHQPRDLEILEALLEHSDAVAVGEIGLDFFIPDADPAAQQQLFKAQLQLAKQFQLPVLLHVRKAHDQVLAQLRRFQLARGGIVHAFSGSAQQAEHYIGLGFKLGFGGAISYDRARKLRRLVAELPLESMVLETDAPDMPLAEYREQPNTPERIRQVAEIIAQLRGISVDEVARVTTATARQLLDLK